MSSSTSLCRATLTLFAVTGWLAAPGRTQLPAMTATPCPPPVYAGVYSYAAQAFVSGEIDGSVVLDNTAVDVEAFFYPPDPIIVAMDWGVFDGGPAGANAITGMRIAYATDVPGTVDLQVNLHAGATGFGDIGDVIHEFVLTGLPGSNVESAVSSHLVAVRFDQQVVLPDGPIGWSFDALTYMHGALGTGPLLVTPTDDAIENALDMYDTTQPGLPLVVTSWFGGSPFASFYIALYGQTPAECWLLLGMTPTSLPYLGDPDDLLLVDPLLVWPVTMESVPVFHIPDDPALDGLNAYWQVFMFNPQVFPADPVQFSNGLVTTLGGDLPRPYGPDTTIDLVPQAPTPLGGQVDLSFTIEGM